MITKFLEGLEEFYPDVYLLEKTRIYKSPIIIQEWVLESMIQKHEKRNNGLKMFILGVCGGDICDIYA
jgi:hypothetical protein